MKADRGGLRHDPGQIRAQYGRLRLHQRRPRRPLAQGGDSRSTADLPCSRAGVTRAVPLSSCPLYLLPACSHFLHSHSLPPRRNDASRYGRPDSARRSVPMPSVDDRFSSSATSRSEAIRSAPSPELVEGSRPGRRPSRCSLASPDRQDVHDGAGPRSGEPPHAGDGAQQDAGRSALSGIQALLPENAVEYFVSYYDYYQPEAYVPRPTRTSRRKRRSTTRSTGCACPPPVALRTARRHHRRHRVVHLRPRVARGVLRMLLPLEIGQRDRPRDRSCGSWSRSVRAQRRRVRPRHLPRTRRHRRSGPVLRRHGAPHRAVRRRDGRAGVVRPAHRKVIAVLDASRSTRARISSPAADRRSGRRSIQAELATSHGGLERRQAARSAATPAADHVRPRDDARDRYCHGIENYSRHLTGRRPASRRRRCSIIFRTIACSSSSTSRTSPCRRSAGCTSATARARSTGRLRLPAPSALDNRPLLRGMGAAGRQVVFVSATPGRLRADGRGRRGRAGDPPDQAHGSADRSAPGPGPGGRSTAGDPQPWRATERVLVTTLTKRMAEDLTTTTS